MSLKHRQPPGAHSGGSFRAQLPANWKGPDRGLGRPQTGCRAAEFLEQHGQDLVSLLYSTVATYRDKRSQAPVRKCLATALTNAAFVRTFASAYAKSVLTDKGALTGDTTAAYTLVQWGCLLLRAIAQRTDLAAAQGKVLEVIGRLLDALRTTCVPFAVPTAVPDLALAKLAATLRYIPHRQRKDESTPPPRLRDAAITLTQSPKASAGVAAALVSAFPDDSAAREAAVAAYTRAALGCKEKVPDAVVEAWGAVVAQLSARELAAAVDTLATMVKRSAETALANARNLFSAARHDASPAALAAAELLVPLLRHSKDAVVARTAEMLPGLAACVQVGLLLLQRWVFLRDCVGSSLVHCLG